MPPDSGAPECHSQRAARGTPLRRTGTVLLLLAVAWLGLAPEESLTLGWVSLGASLALVLAVGKRTAATSATTIVEPAVPQRTPALEPPRILVPAAPPRATSNQQALADAQRHALAAASHEVRTPLTSILAAVEIVKRTQDGESETRQEFVGIIEHEARRLLAFLTNVLEAEKLATGKVELACELHDLGLVVENVAGEAFARLREGGVTLRITRPQTRLLCRCDEDRMTQLLRSLLEEAVRWSPRGGVVDLQVVAEADRIHVRIHDEGPVPIAPGASKESAPDTTVRERNLAFEVCRAIAELHGFGLTCTAAEGGGCCYEVVAQRAPSPAQGTPFVVPH